MPSHQVRLRVRYAETDQMGIVYHANYLIWMEVGRVEYCRNAGLRYRDLERDAEIHLAVVEANCRYLAPARYDEEVIVDTSIDEVSPRMVRFAYQIRNAESNNILVTGFTKHVFLGPDLKPCKLPEQYRAFFGL